MALDLIIKNGLIVTPQATYRATVAAREGKIVFIGSNDLLAEKAKHTIDADGLYVLPGVIDAHVHLREPGYTYKEDYASGTMAAAAGGVTMVMDMPNCKPPVSSREALELKKSLAAPKAYVDYGIYGLLGQDNLDDLLDLVEGGVIGFKCYMGKTVGEIPPPDDGVMLEAFQIIAPTGLRVAVHAENDAIMDHLIKKFKQQGRTDPLAHVDSRPPVCAMEAVQRAVLFSKVTGCKLHICHEGSKDVLPIIRQAKAEGVQVTVETGPHYLLLTAEDMHRLGNILRMNPPVRYAGNREYLWEALKDGTIDMIATDHSPHLPEEKNKTGSVWEAISGFPGVETAVPLMLTCVNEGRMTLNEYVKWSSENPAKVWGLFPEKGCIQVGSEASFTIVDMSRTGVIEAEKLHSKSKVTPFDGFQVKGMPVYTIVRGDIVMEHGEIVGPPRGQLVKGRVMRLAAESAVERR